MGSLERRCLTQSTGGILGVNDETFCARNEITMSAIVINPTIRSREPNGVGERLDSQAWMV